MGLDVRTISRYRPRFLTLVVLVIVAAPTTLANFSSEIVPDAPKAATYKGMYGWPLTWHWHNLILTPGPCGITGWDYSAPRLAANVGLWLLMLAAAVGPCEWLLRRHPLRLRWSLRAMLVAVGLVAVACAFVAAARNRANLQDPMIAELEEGIHWVYVERPAPKWLDFIVPDRFRRRIVGVEMQINYRDTVDEEFVERLGRLPRLQFLKINVEKLTPRIAAAVAGLRRLRWLALHSDTSGCHAGLTPHEFLSGIGKLTELEGLYLEFPEDQDGRSFGQSLACLAGLAKLKSLNIDIYSDVYGLSELPALPSLESIDLGLSYIRGRDLRRLAVLPRLKSLDLHNTILRQDASLADLASLESLEVLAIDSPMLTTRGLNSLFALKRLKALHITQSRPRNDSDQLATPALGNGAKLSASDDEMDGLRPALRRLREFNPGLTVDADPGTGYPDFEITRPLDCEEPDRPPTWLPARFGPLPAFLLRPVAPSSQGPAGESEPEGGQTGDD